MIWRITVWDIDPTTKSRTMYDIYETERLLRKDGSLMEPWRSHFVRWIEDSKVIAFEPLGF